MVELTAGIFFHSFAVNINCGSDVSVVLELLGLQLSFVRKVLLFV